MRTILFITFILLANLKGNDIESNKFAFSPDFFGLGGIGPNIEYIYKDFSIKTGIGMMIETQAFPISIYKNISFNNKITDIIGTPEVGLGFVTYDNDRKYIGTYLCTNFKKRFDYGMRSFPYISKSIYLRYGFYYGLLQYPVFNENKYKTRYWGMLQIGVVKYLSFGIFK